MTQLPQEQTPKQKNNAPVELPKSIPQIVDSIRKGNLDYTKLSEEHQCNREVIAAAVYMDARIINGVPKSAQHEFLDDRYVQRLVKENGAIFPIALASGVFPEYLSSNKLLWKEAAISAPSVIAKIPANLFKTKEEYHNFIKEIIVKNTEAYFRLTPELKDNEEIALTLINTNQGVNYFRILPEKLLTDENFIKKALSLNGEIFKFLRDKTNPTYILTAVASDSTIIRLIPEKVLQDEKLQESLIRVSINAKKELEARGIKLSPNVEKVYFTMKAAYDHLGIDLRMHDRNNRTIDVNYFDNSQEIIRNRYSVASDQTKEKLEGILGKEYFKNINTAQPICLVIYPRYDGAAFNQNLRIQRDSIDRLCNSHRVIFYQASDTNELVDNFREATTNGKNKISLLVLGGHGDPYSILLSENKDLNISQSDLYPRLKEFMESASTVILNSCSTGAKTPAYGQLNIASFLAGIWPESTVIAPTKDTYQAQISSTIDGSAVSAFYENKDGAIPRLELPTKGSVELSFNQEKADIKAALERIYNNILKTGGGFYFTSRHGISSQYLGIPGKEVQAANMTPWEKEALGDLLALRIMKDFVDTGIILQLKNKGKAIGGNVEQLMEKTILKSLNLKEEYRPLVEINPLEKSLSISIKRDFNIIYSCKFNYDNLELISSSIIDPLALSELKN